MAQLPKCVSYACSLSPRQNTIVLKYVFRAHDEVLDEVLALMRNMSDDSSPASSRLAVRRP